MLFPRCFRRFLRTLGPYQCLLVLAVPLAVVEPLKMLAVFIIGEGRFITGVIVMVCAYAGSLLVAERLFAIVKPKLLKLPWFATIWHWFVAVRDKTLFFFRF
ncbi:MAG: hypothetical protein WA851_25235 [Xanthobacteraceae bacterium]